MTSLTPTHRRLTSPVSGEISPRTSAPDAICERLYSFHLIWSLKWIMFCLFFLFPPPTHRWQNYDLEMYLHPPAPLNPATYSDTKPLNASSLYCLVVFEHKSCWNDLWSIIFFTSHHFIWFKPIATVCLKYNKLCFFCCCFSSEEVQRWGTDAAHLFL